jgi:hypothetical protein
MVPMMLGNVHDETACRAREHDVGTGSGGAGCAVHEYLGPVTAEEAVAEFRRSIRTTRRAGGPGGGDGVPRLAGAAMGGGAAGGESGEPAAYVGVPDELPGPNGWAMHTIDIPFMFDNIAMAAGQMR